EVGKYADRDLVARAGPQGRGDLKVERLRARPGDHIGPVADIAPVDPDPDLADRRRAAEPDPLALRRGRNLHIQPVPCDSPAWMAFLVLKALLLPAGGGANCRPFGVVQVRGLPARVPSVVLRVQPEARLRRQDGHERALRPLRSRQQTL